MERDQGTRCQGIYASQVSGPQVELASITVGQIKYDLAAPGSLSLGVFGNPPLTYTVHFRAVALLPTVFYQMDAGLPPNNATFTWPLEG